MSEQELKPGGLAWRASDPIWDAISIYDGPEAFLEQFRRMRPELGHLFAVCWCESEVCNGGFHQFFSNSTGVLAPEAAEGFRGVGLPECAELVEEAMRFFGSPYPRERQRRNESLSRLLGGAREEWDPFCKLDDRFYGLVDSRTNRFERAIDDYARRLSV